MELSEDVILAIELKNKNAEIKAPINDIVQCIEDIRETGLSGEQLRTMVPNIFISSNSSSYMNSPRYPANDEILVYDISDSWIDIMNGEEEHNI
jgi:hypothetical protein